MNITIIWLSLFFQGAIATFLTMPLDVMKTRMMNAKPGTYSVSMQ